MIRARLSRAAMRSLTVVTVVGLTLLHQSGSALADCHNVGPATGSNVTLNQGPQSGTNKSRGTFTWNVTSTSYTIKAYDYAPTDGKCETAWFDWSTDSGHYDSRAVRLCYPGYVSYSATSSEVGLLGDRVLNSGAQKLRACWGVHNSASQTCTNKFYGTGSCATWNASHVLTSTNKVTKYWIKAADGTPIFHDGGVAWDD